MNGFIIKSGDMKIFLAVIFILYFQNVFANRNGKTLTRAKASGPGVSVYIHSIKECLSICRREPECDAVNYQIRTKKCRFFSRCSPYTLNYTDSLNHIHFAKRPPSPIDGYVYHWESDSCLKLIEQLSDYANADNICHKYNGRLVALTEEDIHKTATNLLKESDGQYAWIGLTDSGIEGDPLHSDGRRVSETETRLFIPAAQGHRNDTTRNCWSLSDSGEWTEHSCKRHKHYSICQIPSYISQANK